MRQSRQILTVGLVVAGLVALSPALLEADQFWGSDVGIISATVEKTDSERGLTVRSSPSAQGAPRAYLPVGTEVRGYASFKNGYVKLDTPVARRMVEHEPLEACRRRGHGEVGRQTGALPADQGRPFLLVRPGWMRGTGVQSGINRPLVLQELGTGRKAGFRVGLRAGQIDSGLMPPQQTTYASNSSSYGNDRRNESDLASGVYEDTDDGLWYNERKHRGWRWRHRRDGDFHPRVGLQPQIWWLARDALQAQLRREEKVREHFFPCMVAGTGTTVAKFLKTNHERSRLPPSLQAFNSEDASTLRAGNRVRNTRVRDKVPGSFHGLFPHAGPGNQREPNCAFRIGGERSPLHTSQL